MYQSILCEPGLPPVIETLNAPSSLIPELLSQLIGFEIFIDAINSGVSGMFMLNV